MRDTESPEASRRETLQRLFALVALPATLPVLAACGASGAGNDPIVLHPTPPAATPTPPPAPVPTPAPPSPTPPAGTPLDRLRAAIAATAPVVDASVVLTVTQGASQSANSSFGSGARFLPAWPESATNNLATATEVWGWQRDRWPQAGGRIASQGVIPAAVVHAAATLASTGRVGLHFIHTGSAFELLVAGANNAITLVADGRIVGCGDASQPLAQLNTTLSGGPLNAVNTTIKLDFGTSATRHVSLYSMASQGACALVVAAGDTVTAWDRHDEASFAAVSDSYGGTAHTAWGWGGLHYRAAQALGIPNVDLDAIGGTGYAPNPNTADTLIAGNAFDARLPSITATLPDLFVTTGSLNDNNEHALPPYASADAARAGFAAAVSRYYTDLRARLPGAVLAATGPWQPPTVLPASDAQLDKVAVIKAALVAVGAPWVFVDNVHGGWSNSSGASSSPSAVDGPWQTADNAAAYISGDSVHPNAAGTEYLGGRLGAALRAAILAL